MKKILAMLLIFYANNLFADCELNHDLEFEVLSINKEKTSSNNQVWFFEIKNANGMQYKLEVKVYSSSSSKPDKALIVIPTIKGDSFIERNLAGYFARKGYASFIPIISEIDFSFDSSTACQMDQMYLRVQESLMALSLEIDKADQPIEKYLLGGSQGGIRSIIAASTVSNLKAVWTNVAGGDFPSLYAESKVGEIEDFRKQHMAYLGLHNRQDYEVYLRQNLIYDPLNACSGLRVPISMVVALKDDSVPTKNQKSLAKACKPIKTKDINTGHFRGVLDLIFNKKEILGFFENPPD